MNFHTALLCPLSGQAIQLTPSMAFLLHECLSFRQRWIEWNVSAMGEGILKNGGIWLQIQVFLYGFGAL
jgi:hypothetical protein